MVGVWSVPVLVLIVQLFEFRGVAGRPGTVLNGIHPGISGREILDDEDCLRNQAITLIDPSGRVPGSMSLTAIFRQLPG
jgi:hypothetical protein